ncbi:hypothetical protein C8R43DRAFT_941139 [Mycena crocata]|nr:hypothetical protein C8R43DRAFT_941139 [Mycena crocata]
MSGRKTDAQWVVIGEHARELEFGVEVESESKTKKYLESGRGIEFYTNTKPKKGIDYEHEGEKLRCLSGASWDSGKGLDHAVLIDWYRADQTFYLSRLEFWTIFIICSRSFEFVRKCKRAGAARIVSDSNGIGIKSSGISESESVGVQPSGISLSVCARDSKAKGMFASAGDAQMQTNADTNFAEWPWCTPRALVGVVEVPGQVCSAGGGEGEDASSAGVAGSERRRGERSKYVPCKIDLRKPRLGWRLGIVLLRKDARSETAGARQYMTRRVPLSFLDELRHWRAICGYVRGHDELGLGGPHQVHIGTASTQRPVSQLGLGCRRGPRGKTAELSREEPDEVRRLASSDNNNLVKRREETSTQEEKED